MIYKWTDFLDKVYGCWLGKCIAGTIGAPYEGYKGNLRVEFSPELFASVLPNDDLDLQVLWLDVIENVGPGFTSDDLAAAFYEKCPYSPGEYATFKKNYELGLKPPVTGSFNNVFYKEGMGSPIRSEIWACLTPWNPKLAAENAAKDGCLDHEGESVIAEQFLAALESLAFYEKYSVSELIVKALSYVDKESRFSRLVGNVIEWCEQYNDIKAVFSRILRKYGHSDCTNMFQNLGIILAALILGNEDLTASVMMALNCGFDTDCTCATIGAILGIKAGGNAIKAKYCLGEVKYKLGVNLERRSDSVYDLAEDVARAAMLFENVNKKFPVRDVPEDIPRTVAVKPRFPVNALIEYVDNNPSVRPGETRVFKIKLLPVYKMRDSGTVKVTVPEGFTVKPESRDFRFGLFNPELTFSVSVSKDIPVLMEKNLINFNVTLEKGDSKDFKAGLVGDAVWKVFGPFWENVVKIAPPAEFESYYNGFEPGLSEDEAMTQMRQFHLNMKADWSQEYLEDQLLGDAPINDRLLTDPNYQGFTAYITGDCFSFKDIMSNTMPCVIYMVRDLYAPEDMNVCLQVGHSDAFKLWINGDLIAYKDTPEHWTPENLHRKNIKLNKGGNKIVLKLARTSGTTDFSLIFTKAGACTDQYTCFGSGKIN